MKLKKESWKTMGKIRNSQGSPLAYLGQENCHFLQSKRRTHQDEHPANIQHNECWGLKYDVGFRFHYKEAKRFNIFI